MKKFICALLAASLVSATVISVSASDIVNAKAQLRPDFTIVIDGKETGFKSAAGSYVYPILYNDSTYLPLRSIGEIMGKNVNWDESSKTVTISGTRASSEDVKPSSSTRTSNVDIQERKDFTIIIDGSERTFKDANGKTVYPLLYNGSTYLPLRAVGQIMGSDVGWDAQSKTVTLTSTCRARRLRTPTHSAIPITTILKIQEA